MLNNLNRLNQSRANSRGSNSSENSFLNALEQNYNIEYSRSNFHIPLSYQPKFTDKNIKATEPYLSSFVVSVNGTRAIDLQQITDDIIVSKLPFKEQEYTNNGMKLKVTKVVARAGNFKAQFTITSEYGRVGLDTGRISCLDFFVDVTMGLEIAKARMQIFSKNGKITIQGGYLNQQLENIDNEIYFEAQPELIRNFIVDNYTDKRESFRADFKYDNVVGQFKLNRGLGLSLIYKEFAVSPLFSTVSYETQLNPLLTFTLKDNTTKFSFSSRGTIQLKGLKNAIQLDDGYKSAIKLIQKLIDYDKNHPETHILKILKNVPNSRLKKQRVTANNLPAPNVKRRTTTCPFNRCPTPYSIHGKCPKPGYYVKPNPQGQPCCFKIPKRISFSKNKVKAAYNRAGVKVPNNVRRIFNFGNNTNNKLPNTTHNNLNVTITIDPVKGLKIGTRQAIRYSRVALVNIASRLSIPMSGKFMSKEKLINLISSKSRNVTTNFVSFTVGTTSHKLSGNSVKTLRVDERLVASFTKPKLIKFAMALRIAAKEAHSAADIVKSIYDEYRRRRPKPKSLVASATGSSRSSSPGITNAEAYQMVLNQLGLNKKVLEDNIKREYGDAWLKKWGPFMKSIPEQADELSLYLVKNVGNDPTANSMKVKKIAVIKQWKEKYEKELRAMAWSNIGNTNVRNSVMKYASTRKNGGNFPTRSEIEKYRNIRIGLGGAKSPNRARARGGETEEF